jgi:hypothetical protein
LSFAGTQAKSSARGGGTMKKMPVNITLCVILLSSGTVGMLGCARGLVNTNRSSDLSNQMVYALPKGYIKVVWDTETIKVETIYEPDEQHYYLLKYTTNIGFDDDITMAVNEKGLLSSIDVTTTSKIPDIVKKVGEIAVSALEIAVMRGQISEKPFELIIDPEEIPEYPKKPNEKSRKTYGWEKYITSISLEHPKAISFLYESASQSASEHPPDENRCICYRPALPFKLRLLVGEVYIERVVYLPNYSKLITFDITRPAFVQQIQNLTFTDGLLTQVRLKKDSELLAFLGIPADLVKTAAGLPLALMEFKTQNVQGETSLLQAQTALIQAQMDLQNKKNQSRTDREFGNLKKELGQIKEELRKLKEAKTGRSE